MRPTCPRAGKTGFVYGSQVLDKDWRAIDIFYDDVLDLFYIVNQADTPHDIGLRAFRDHVAAYVDITFAIAS